MIGRRAYKWLAVAAVALLIGAGVGWMLLWSEEPLISPDVSGFPVRGADISAHNGDVDFGRLAREENLKFVYLKATEGRRWKDRRFNINYIRARHAGLKVGAYHFVRFDVDAESQALNLIQSLRGKTLDLPVALDIEEWTNPYLKADSVGRMVKVIADMLAGEGYPVIVYTNKQGHGRYIENRLDSVPLWICSLSSKLPEQDWIFWQYSHRGSAAGVAGDLDLNVFWGDSTAWHSFLSRPFPN
ncbi:MAG: hypothetical protein K2M05_05900 [Paramuribaculum sp.]|nr:hypothetical protein [Paramuribaculum sp.]MDE6304060.1 hypothetical protein [Paramuribaculum sp.]